MQLSGMVAIFYYAVSFFKSAGISEENAGFANLGVGAIMVTMTLVTVPLMDRFVTTWHCELYLVSCTRLGRRVLHLSGLVGMFVMALLIVVAQNLISQVSTVQLIGTRGAVLHHSAETVLCFRIHVLCFFSSPSSSQSISSG